MKPLAADYPIEDLAWAMDVSRSGYYRWLKAPESKRVESSRQLTEHIHRIHLENLCRLAELPPAGSWIIVAGLRPASGSGSPATVFGLIP